MPRKVWAVIPAYREGITGEGITESGLLFSFLIKISQSDADDAGSRFGEQDLGWLGTTARTTAHSLAEHIKKVLNRLVVHVSTAQAAIKKIAWCTGGAKGYFEAAIAAGADVYITGEISEPQAHYAREMGVAYIACGHHASERYSAPAVASTYVCHVTN